ADAGGVWEVKISPSPQAQPSSRTWRGVHGATHTGRSMLESGSRLSLSLGRDDIRVFGSCLCLFLALAIGRAQAQSDSDIEARARAIHERVLTVDTHVDIPADF